MTAEKVTIREARSSDREEIVSLLSESFTGSYRYWAIKDSKYTHNLVAQVGKEIVGVVELYCKKVQGLGNVGVIYFLAVKKEHRHKGLGAQLVVESEKLFRRWKCDYSAASTVLENKASINLFKKLGYEIISKSLAEKMGSVKALYAYEDDVFFLKKLK